jgi:hypothetical protein
VIVAARGSAGREELRTGELGAYQIIRDIEAALEARTSGSRCSPSSPSASRTSSPRKPPVADLALTFATAFDEELGA